MVRRIILASVLAAFGAGSAPAAEPSIPLSTLKTDISKLRGKRIDVSGHLSVLGEVATLGNDAADSHTVLVELANLSRDQRQALTAKCNAGCDVRLTGKGGLVLRDPGVIAIDLHLADEMPSRVASGTN